VRAAGVAGTVANARLFVLFGSVARGEARSDSDVDLAVLGPEYWDVLRVGATLAAELGREPHVVDLATAPDLLRYEVAAHGILLFEHEPFAWARFRAESAVRYFDLAPVIATCAAGVRRRLAAEAHHG
jgi:predicted nucleotidyltransferase